MTEENGQPHDLILDLLRAIRTDISGLKTDMAGARSDILSLRKDVHGLRGEMLRFEESLAGMGTQIDRINTRLGLNETPQ